MHKIVKESFLLIMMVFLAWILYILFFGVSDSMAAGGGWWTANASYNVREADGSVRSTRWEGLLFYAAREIENPIASYYYNYCYLPSTHATDYLDVELGARVYGYDNIDAVTYNHYRTTPIGSDSYITYPSSGHHQATR